MSILSSVGDAAAAVVITGGNNRSARKLCCKLNGRTNKREWGRRRLILFLSRLITTLERFGCSGGDGTGDAEGTDAGGSDDDDDDLFAQVFGVN